MKPLCDACGTPNAIDSMYCQQCGVRLIIKEKPKNPNYDVPPFLSIPNKIDNDKIQNELEKWRQDQWHIPVLGSVDAPLLSTTTSRYSAVTNNDETRSVNLNEISDTSRPHSAIIERDMRKGINDTPKYMEYQIEPRSAITGTDMRKGIPKSTQNTITQIEQAQTWSDKTVAKTLRTKETGRKQIDEYKKSWKPKIKDVKEDELKKDYSSLYIFLAPVLSIFGLLLWGLL